MSRPFTPGEDRLAALPTTESEVSGCPVLADSHAVLDCKVVSRMDAGDHTVIYAEVEGGHVNKENELTAVLHRKVGNHY
jgi:flavin reductase (DIM6/NTAB) family NADH-FMN oxidoreductase RutF